MVSALSLFFALDASLSRQETHWKMILNDINDVFYMIYKLGWPDLSLWKRYDTGIKGGVITFIVKVIAFYSKGNHSWHEVVP